MSDQTYVNRRGAVRDRPMEVLGLGLGRTGTDSLRVALKTLGFDDCYHGYSCVHENPPDNYMWNEALDAKYLNKGKPYGRAEWDQLLGHCRAVTDLPCVAFAEELIEAYPDAKVVISLPPKGADKWYESSKKTLLTLRNSKLRDVWSFFNQEAWLTRQTFWRAFDFFFEFDYEKNAIMKMEEQSALVQRLVPPEKLLMYNVTEGWEPLCKFFDKPIPSTPFPAGNDPQDFFRRFAEADSRRKKQAILDISKACAGGLALAVVFFAWRPQYLPKSLYRLFRY